jgi:hypothetical protein
MSCIRTVFCGIADQKREKIKTERGVAKEIGRKEEGRREISSEVEDFKLSVTSLIPFFYLNLYIYFVILFFVASFRFLFPLERMLDSSSFFFYPLSPIRMKKYVYPTSPFCFI